MDLQIGESQLTAYASSLKRETVGTDVGVLHSRIFAQECIDCGRVAYCSKYIYICNEHKYSFYRNYK